MTDTLPASDTTIDGSATSVEFWFDPSCPWAWMTSRFVDEVSKHRDLRVTWNIMSLAVLNENNDVDDAHHEVHVRGLAYTRLVTAAKELHGQPMVKKLYDALGQQIHLEGKKDAHEVVRVALAAAGLPDDFAAYSESDEFDEQMRASHFEGIGRVGQDVGTPVMAVDGVAFFGPVMSPAPRGEDALRVWDGVVAVASYDGFFELKRSRTVGPIFD
ncbi:DsbA family protein [Marisediminicola sp. LYQ134]|uniref:mycothiol-dependent nitroreductase Rv2466c family protein n=1 Tax=unclassified Marisediminicola TaxID=2618316 RepID=UPI0039834FBB